MKKVLIYILIIIICVVGFLFFKQKNNDEDFVTFKVECQSKGIYMIFYRMYINGERYADGGISNVDHQELSPDKISTLKFPKAYFEGNDISKISFTLSPYGKDSEEEMGTTNELKINAKYGNTYNIILGGNKEEGFIIKLKK